MQTQQSRDSHADAHAETDIAAESDEPSFHPEAAHSKYAPSDEPSTIQNLNSQIQSLQDQVAGLQSQHAHHAERAGQPTEADLQAAQDALNAEHAQQMTALKTEFECLLEEYTAKDQQVGCADDMLLLVWINCVEKHAQGQTPNDYCS